MLSELTAKRTIIYNSTKFDLASAENKSENASTNDQILDAQLKIEEAQKSYDNAAQDLKEVKDLKEDYAKEVQRVNDTAKLV